MREHLIRFEWTHRECMQTNIAAAVTRFRCDSSVSGHVAIDLTGIRIIDVLSFSAY